MSDADASLTQDPAREPFRPRDGIPPVLTDVASVQAYASALAHGTGPLAVDAERASGFRYSQRAYLVQLRREGAGTGLIDPIGMADLSAIQNATRDVEWILHAATQDLPCLAELGMKPDRLFDTELAGRLLNRERVSLSALVASELGEILEKGHGAADWSQRPLKDDMIAYAALDVELLIELRDSLAVSLEEAGKWEIAQEEFTALLDFTPRERGEDPWRRTSGLHKVRSPADLAVVRSLWWARDRLAQESDVAPGRLLPDSALIAVAQGKPRDIEALRTLPGFHGRGAARYLRTWWKAVLEARAMESGDLPSSPAPSSGPPQPRTWADRNPAAWKRLTAAREALATIADQRDLPVENLLSPEPVRRLCWEPPAPITPDRIEGFLRDQGARQWQVDATVIALQQALVTGE